MTTLEPRNDAFVLGLVLSASTVAVLVANRHRALCSVQNQLDFALGQCGVRRVDIDVVGLAHRLKQACKVLGMSRGPRPNRTVGNREIGVRNDQFRVDLIRGAEPVAGLTRAVWRVEREVSRCEFVVAGSAMRTRQMLREREDFGLGLAVFRNQLNLGHTFGQLERCLE